MFAIYGWENRKLTRKSSLSLINKVNFRFSDRKSTRLNSSHLVISYAVFCLKKKKRLKAAFQLMWIDWAPETMFYAFVNLPKARIVTSKEPLVHLYNLVDTAIYRS